MHKRSSTLALLPVHRGFEAFDYRTGAQFECSVALVEFLSTLDDWTDTASLEWRASDLLGCEADASLATLLELGVLIHRGSAEAADEDQYLQQWQFGPSTGIFHQSVSDRPITPIADQIDYQIEKSRTEPSPRLFYEPEADARTVRLPDPRIDRGLYPYLERRRTHREGVTFDLELETLADILYAGLGVTDWTVNRAQQRLPLRYAPSGGARNPYDAYVFVYRAVELDCGVYRYSGVRHSLTQQEDSVVLPRPSELLGGQEWADCASALIVLVANFPRSMWKYAGDDNAYRVILIEAGHIAQNAMLMAASAGIAACPSAALNHEAIAKAANLVRYEQAPIYAMALTKPAQA